MFTKHDSRPDLSFSPEVTHRDQARDTLIRNQPLERKGIGRKLTHSRNQNPEFYYKKANRLTGGVQIGSTTSNDWSIILSVGKY